MKIIYFVTLLILSDLIFTQKENKVEPLPSPSPSSITNITNSTSLYKMQWDLCYSKNEQQKPQPRDCLIIAKHCCFASYTVIGYSFTTCFYNKLTNYDRAKEWFKISFGAITSAPTFNQTIICTSGFISLGLYVLIISLIQIFI